jgi:hypothetical protein
MAPNGLKPGSGEVPGARGSQLARGVDADADRMSFLAQPYCLLT